MCGLPLAKPECIVDVADRSLGGFCPRVPCIGFGGHGTLGKLVIPVEIKKTACHISDGPF